MNIVVPLLLGYAGLATSRFIAMVKRQRPPVSRHFFLHSRRHPETMAAMKYAMSLLAFCSLLLLPTQISSQQTTKALLLFGGKDHKVMLGCLNCVSTSKLSVCNEFGDYGSEFNSGSIWNEFGTYGSEFNQYSPWNEYTTSAPIVVDMDGKSYGYFSANEYHNDRTRIGWLVAILDYHSKVSDLEKTRKRMCGD